MRIMSTTPIPAPRSKRTAPNPPVSQRHPAQTRTGNVTEETQGPDQQASSGSDEAKPPRPPPPQSRSSPQDGTHNKNKMPGNAKHVDTVTTEDETSRKSYGKTRKLPLTPDASSYLFDGNKTYSVSHQEELSSQPSTAADQLKAVGGGSSQDGFRQESATRMANQSQRPTEDKPLADAQDKDHAGQRSTTNKPDKDMAKSFVQAWRKLYFEIRCQGQKPINFDATDMFQPPALLQFALTSEQQKSVSFDQLKKQNILLTVTNDCLTFTYNIEKKVGWNEDDLQKALIETLAGDILNDVRCIKEKIDWGKGLNILENIQIKKPPVLRRGQVLLYTLDNEMFIVGSERNLNKFMNECQLQQSDPEPTKVTQKVQVSLKSLTDRDIYYLTKLELVADIENAVPGVSFSVEKKIIQGTVENVHKAVEMLNKVINSKKEVVFKNSVCAKVFVEDNVKNETLCDFIKSKVLKCKKIDIKKCYIAVEPGEIPRVYVYCMNEKAAITAADIISDCLCLNKMSKELFEKVKRDVRSWFDNGQIYTVYSSEKEIYVATTSDITEKFNKLLTEKVDTTKTVPVPELACRYFNQFGSSLLAKVHTDYKVFVNIAEDSFTLSGIPENVTKAKHFIKDSYAGERINVETDISLIDQKKLQFDDVTQKHKCCWNAKPNSSDRKGMLKNVQYQASWCNPPTNSKLTVVEGSADDIEFDILLVFVTDSLFPIISKSNLNKGFERFIGLACEEFTKDKKERRPPGAVGLFPQHMKEGVIKSKEVMYLVVQKSTEIEGSRSMPLLTDLVEAIRRLSKSSEVSSIGIPIETDDLEGTFKESELCNQVSAAWINNWSKLKNMPEVFLCATTSTENVVEMIDGAVKYTRGFSKQNFALREEASDVPDFVHTQVKIGDLLHSKADVIVNTTARNLDLRDGFISSLILKNAGDSVQDECNKNYPKGIEHAEVAVTGSGNLRHTAQVKNILHSSLQKYACQKHDMAIDCVKRFVRNCLYTAERLEVISIAFPSLGTGKLCYPRRDVAAAMFDAVEEYKREAIYPRLRHIYFMVYGGDKTVCQAFQNEEWRRLDQNKNLHKDTESSEYEVFLKKVLPCGEAPLECRVCVNVQNIPAHFVVVNFNNIAPGRETSLTLKSAKDPLSSWNDELISSQEIDGEVKFRKMVKQIIDKTDDDRITGLVFNPLTKSSFKCSIGQQIKLFTAEVEQLGFTDQRKRSLIYLREIWFAVDESGFSNAEHCLLSGTIMKSINNLTGGTSWENLPISETSHRASINVIGPSKDVVQAAVIEMKAILKQEPSSSQTQGKQLSSSVVFKPGRDQVYTSLGFGNPQIHHSQQGNPELKKNPKIPPKEETGTEDKKMQTFVSQGARPKQTGVSQKSSIDPSGPLKTGTDRQDSKDKESSLLDALEVTANINQGIVAFLRAIDEDKLSEWTERVAKVFEIRFETTMEKLTVHGSFFQVKTFQDYLNNDFPEFPEETIDSETEDDKSESTEDAIVTAKSSVVTNSEDGIVFQFQVGNVQVFVYKGDLTKVKVDCIVSSASSTLNGKMGLEMAILDAAGGQVRQECKSYIKQKRRLSSGEVLVTNGGNLRCKKVIHFAMPGLMASDGERKLVSSLSRCIKETEKEGLQSIAIPALGSVSSSASNRLLEKFGVCLYHAVSTHGEKEDSSLKVVHFVDKNNKLVSSVLEALSAKFSCLRINQATIYVAQGNVTATKADAIVVFQDSNFNFNSKIAKDVAALSGDQYSQALELLKDQAPGIGTVFRSKATGDMATLCASVLHAVILEDFGDEKKKGIPTTQEIKMTCKDIFAKSRKINVSTLGVPVFEVEELNKTEYLSAMAEFVFEYFCSTEEPSVKEIHFLSEDMDAVRSFVECLQKQITQVEKLKKENKLAFHFATKKETEIY